MNTFDEAFEERGQPQNLIFHSDQGVQYTSCAFRTHLEELQCRQSFSAPGYPYDNSVCESFFNTLKKEAIYYHIYDSAAELAAVLDEYIEYYNEVRMHRTLKIKDSPACGQSCGAGKHHTVVFSNTRPSSPSPIPGNKKAPR